MPNKFARQNRRANSGMIGIRLTVFIIIPLLLLISSCAKTTIQHPGALNSFDNTAYDTLITEQAAIEQAKVNIVSFPQFKVTLNHVIDEYNVTMNAYKIYHQAGATGDVSSLQTQINTLITDVASLIKSMIPVAPKVP